MSCLSEESIHLFNCRKAHHDFICSRDYEKRTTEMVGEGRCDLGCGWKPCFHYLWSLLLIWLAVCVYQMHQFNHQSWSSAWTSEEVRCLASPVYPYWSCWLTTALLFTLCINHLSQILIVDFSFICFFVQSQTFMDQFKLRQ